MITTNLLATVVISIVTNWVSVYEQIPYWQNQQNLILCNSTYVQDSPVTSINYPIFTVPEPTQGKYLGKDGTVVKITEIKFTYENKKEIHRIEDPIEKIIMRCTEKPPIPTEYIWQDPIHESLTNNVETNRTYTNTVNIISSNIINNIKKD
jgi:hypothetical protein